MIDRILVPTDFSEAADGALRYAIRLAKPFGARIALVHVFQLSSYASPSSDLARSLEADLKRELDAVIERERVHGIDMQGHLRLGIPYVEICAAAEELGANLIVMGTIGRSALEHLLVGSVTERVVRTSEVPVLTLRKSSS